MMRRLTMIALGLGVAGCAVDDRGMKDDMMMDSTESESTGEDDGAGDDGVKLDVNEGMGTAGDSGYPGDCGAPNHIACDADSDDPLQAMGVNCENTEAEGGFTGNEAAMAVYQGTLGPWSPREGEKFVVLSTGIATQIGKAPSELADCQGLGGDFPCNSPSTELSGPYDYDTLPEPIDVTPVHDSDTCEDDSGLIGTGDCSNTLSEQWAAAMMDGLGGTGLAVANDYAEVRLRATVPPMTEGVSFDFAFMSVEYPDFYQSTFNDMFVAWLESETWTGNISFDEEGNPISLNAGFLDYKDAQQGTMMDPDCLSGCTAEELHGMAMQGHAATKWLSSNAAVVPGEEIELVFAVFDLSDGVLDSVVLLDNFHWSCDGDPPSTIPID